MLPSFRHARVAAIEDYYYTPLMLEIFRHATLMPLRRQPHTPPLTLLPLRHCRSHAGFADRRGGARLLMFALSAFCLID